MISVDIEGLRDDLRGISETLQSVESRVRALRPHTNLDGDGNVSALERAKDYYRRRRHRETLFGKGNLFADPAWDMLIDLFIAAEEGRDISVSSLCIAAAVPTTTALRWIAILESNDLIVRTADPVDARRFFLALTSSTSEKLRSYFQQ